MLTEEDIKKLISVFATRDEVALKSDFDRLREDFSNLQTSVDAYAKKADTYFQEMSAMRHALHRHEDALKKIAEKIGIKLDF